MWHDAQDGTFPPLATSACEFVSGKPNAVWSNLPSDHFVIGWQDVQADAVEGNPAVMWLGTLPPKVGVLFQAARWQPMQSVEFKV
jgi:hypothetical protein